MFRETGQSDPSSCPSLELLLRHVIQPEGLSEQQCDDVVRHLAGCSHCGDIYDALCQAESELCDEVAEAAGLPKRELQFTRSDEEAVADLWRRVNEEEDHHRQLHRRALAFRVRKFAAAMAACVALVIVGGWLMNSHLKPASPKAPQGYAELVTSGGRQTLALGQPVTTRDQRREILLGGMHRVVMNHNTAAAFTADSQGRYQVQLAQGELYVEVVPGHPFIVTTANARLEITGTKFDVKAAQDKTELTLLKGSVRFASLSQDQSVDVKAGYTSAVVGQSVPTSPATVDAMATTAWARDAVLSNAVARSGSVDAGLQDIIRDSWRQPAPADPDTLDYAAWRNAHRDDCARQFAWAIKAEHFLQSRGIQADWIDVLMVSGDVWQFHYDPKLPGSQPLTKIEPIAVARLARHYGVDEREMLRAVGLPDATPILTLPIQNPMPGQQYADALHRWHDALLASTQGKPEEHGALMLFSLSASRYLATTRTAAYLWVRTHSTEAERLLANTECRAIVPKAFIATDEREWLKKLRQQAVTARSCGQVAMEWFVMPAGNGCQPPAAEKQRNLALLIEELVPAALVPPDCPQEVAR